MNATTPAPTATRTLAQAIVAARDADTLLFDLEARTERALNPTNRPSDTYARNTRAAQARHARLVALAEVQAADPDAADLLAREAQLRRQLRAWRTTGTGDQVTEADVQRTQRRLNNIRRDLRWTAQQAEADARHQAEVAAARRLCAGWSNGTLAALLRELAQGQAAPAHVGLLLEVADLLEG